MTIFEEILAFVSPFVMFGELDFFDTAYGKIWPFFVFGLGNRSLKCKGGLGSSIWLAGHIGNKNGLYGPVKVFDVTLR